MCRANYPLQPGREPPSAVPRAPGRCDMVHSGSVSSYGVRSNPVRVVSREVPSAVRGPVRTTHGALCRSPEFSLHHAPLWYPSRELRLPPCPCLSAPLFRLREFVLHLLGSLSLHLLGLRRLLTTPEANSLKYGISGQTANIYDGSSMEWNVT